MSAVRRIIYLVFSVAVLLQAIVLGGDFGAEARANPPLTRSEALARLPMIDRLTTNETPLSRGGAWQRLSWASQTGFVSNWRWGPLESFPTADGAFWRPSAFADTGAGVATAARVWSSPGLTGRYFALWLDMPAPDSTKTGYELRFTNTLFEKYDIELSRWQAGFRMPLASVSDYELPKHSPLALADFGKDVVVFTEPEPETGYGEILSASDSSFDGGYAGFGAAGLGSRIDRFRAGPLPALAP